jgi:hypothetical protein
MLARSRIIPCLGWAVVVVVVVGGPINLQTNMIQFTLLIKNETIYQNK